MYNHHINHVVLFGRLYTLFCDLKGIVTKRILVVDDDNNTLSILVKYLSSKTPYIIEAAENGLEASNMLEKSSYHLLVTDVEMPYMNGIELLVKAKTSSPDIKVVVMTGGNSKDVLSLAKLRGADTCIKKPFDFDDFIELVHSHCGN